MGRPSDYSPELAALICGELAEGLTLREVCRADDMPAESTVRRWALEDREGFSAQYTRAREIGYHAMADEVIEIADSSRDPADKRLMFDARRWLLSKALPKVYGDKITQEVSGPGGGPLSTITTIELVAVPIPEGRG